MKYPSHLVQPQAPIEPQYEGTLRSLMDRYFVFHASSMKPNSLEAFRYSAASILRHFGVKPFVEITIDDVAAWMAHEKNVNKICGKTLSDKLKLLSYFFRFAEDRGEIIKSPVNKRMLPRIEKNIPKREHFTNDQYQMILKALLEDSKMRDFWPGAVVVAHHTGLRMSDCALLKKSYLNFSESIIRVPTMKKSSRRECLIIPMDPALKEYLTKLVTLEDTGSEYVMPDFRDMYTWDRCRIATEFINFCRKHGLPGHSFHSLRHGFVSRLINALVHPLVIASMTGQSIAVLQSYAHISEDTKRDALSKISPGAVEKVTIL